MRILEAFIKSSRNFSSNSSSSKKKIIIFTRELRYITQQSLFATSREAPLLWTLSWPQTTPNALLDETRDWCISGEFAIRNCHGHYKVVVAGEFRGTAGPAWSHQRAVKGPRFRVNVRAYYYEFRDNGTRAWKLRLACYSFPSFSSSFPVFVSLPRMAEWRN